MSAKPSHERAKAVPASHDRKRPISVGIDVGGTFTDLVGVDASDGTIARGKLFTSPEDPVEAILEGMDRLLEGARWTWPGVDRIVHGTTRAGNALVERRGATAGLITTDGFRDVLEMGNELRYDLYDLSIRRAEPLIPRSRRRGITERLDADGTVISSLDESQLVAEVDGLVADGIDSLAICFLHSYKNPAHEKRAADIVRARYPALSITMSHAIAQELREFERFSTAAANAYVVPMMESYLSSLERSLRTAGFEGALYIMLSGGGITSPSAARAAPILMVESGPAGGVLAASHAAEPVERTNVLAFDMGGTTAKLSALENGRIRRSHWLEVARVHRFRRGSGLPLRVPTVDLVEIGAGGGSQAWVDGMGLLKVGPKSSGAVPGPACYARGGTVPTVTDADLLLGLLNPEYFLGGQLRLDMARAEAAIETHLGPQLGLDTRELARGIFDIVNENMAQAARIYLAERGMDRRRFTLVASGGAGPVHAYEVARRLGTPQVLFPRGAGVASALGMLVAPPTVDVVRSMPSPLDSVDLSELRSTFEEMQADALRQLEQLGVAVGDVSLSWSADMRYLGQGFEVAVELRTIPGNTADLSSAFYEAYGRDYGQPLVGVPVEVVSWRLGARGPVPTLSLTEVVDASRSTEAAIKGEREVFALDGAPLRCSVYDRYRLAEGEPIAGPAIIEEKESTLFIGAGGTAAVRQDGHILVAVAQSSVTVADQAGV